MKILISIILIITAAPIYAGTWTSLIKVTMVDVEGADDGRTVYVTFDNPINPDACTDTYALQMQRVYANTQKGKYMVSAFLTALTSGKDVNALLNGCDEQNRPIITGIKIRN